jgi:hypothetical protein
MKKEKKLHRKMIEEENGINGEQMEFSLTEEEINEWIIKLTELKFHKNPIELDVDDENSLLINFEEDSDEEDSDENS